MWLKTKIKVDGKRRYARHVFDELNENEGYPYSNFSKYLGKYPDRNWTTNELSQWLKDRKDSVSCKNMANANTRKKEALKSPGIIFWVEHTNFWPVVKHEH